MSIAIVAVILGWPAVVASLFISIVAITSGRWRLALVGVVVGSPFLAYLALTPRFSIIAPPVAASSCAAVYALARGRRSLAGALAVPYVLLAAFIALLVLRGGVR